MVRSRIKNFLYAFNAFTVVIFVLLAFEFFTKSRFHLPAAMTTLYLTVLAFYVGDKEFQRAKRRYVSRGRRGERFVYLWTLFLVIVAAIVAFGGSRQGFRIPADLPIITGTVLVLYVITEYLKGRR